MPSNGEWLQPQNAAAAEFLMFEGASAPSVYESFPNCSKPVIFGRTGHPRACTDSHLWIFSFAEPVTPE